MPESIDVRPARFGEHKTVAGCVVAAYSGYVERIGKEPAPMLADYPALISRGVVYVVEDRSEIIGVLVVVLMDGAVLVENVAVSPSHQGLGLGRRLMGFAEELARRNGLPEITLYTNELMTENVAFYYGLGFEETDRRSEDGYHRVFMRKLLARS